MSEAVDGAGDLTKKVLADVSRSFYLSLRLLPAGMREGTGVAYLLARLSDTLADAGGAEVARAGRLRTLRGFCDLMRGEGERESWLASLAVFENATDVSVGERRLLARAGDCLRAFDGQPTWQQAAIREVVATITEGQEWDLTRFDPGKKEKCLNVRTDPNVVALGEEAELERYCYQVAGSVGEFWTRMAAGQGEDFGGAAEEEMMALARKYGEALQLINILRDVPEDLERGRCYVPGVDFSGEKEMRASLLCERERLIAKARAGLRSAHEYCDALRSGRRLRVASRLPAMIGEKTLALLAEADWERWEMGVKIPRKAVRAELWQALWR